MLLMGKEKGTIRSAWSPSCLPSVAGKPGLEKASSFQLKETPLYARRKWLMPYSWMYSFGSMFVAMVHTVATPCFTT